MKKAIIATILGVALSLNIGQAVFADEVSNQIQEVQGIDAKLGSSMKELSSDGAEGSHEQFTAQALKIFENDKGSSAASCFTKYRSIILEYCDKPDADEKDYAFAYHFYNPYTQENYLPSVMSASKTTALTKFQAHIRDAVKYYNSATGYSMKELARAIHFLEDVNVPHHAANMIGGATSHTQYESYINKNEKIFFVNTSNAYNKYSTYSFYDFCDAIFNECAKKAYSYKDIAGSYNEADWKTAATPTLKLAQEDIAALLYRFKQEVGA